MILAIDVGNTNIVVGVLDGRKVLSSARISTNSCGAAYEFAFQVKGALEFNNVDIENLDGAAISSVVPSITTILKDAMAMLKVKKTIVVEAGVKTGLNIKIDDPAQLGADLVAGAVAALTMAKPPMVVIDMGTATTLSAIDKNGVFKGVVIAPGVNLALGALVGGASMLPEVPLVAPPSVIGTNTITSMQSGAVLGSAAMIEGLIERMEAVLGPCAVIATGGISNAVIPVCKRKDIIFDPDLLLIGLAIIWEKNNK